MHAMECRVFRVLKKEIFKASFISYYAEVITLNLSATVIVRRDDKVLLIKRNIKPFKNYWALIGGAKEDNETFEDCAKRELKEEVGLEVEDLRYLTEITVNNKLGLQLSKVFMCVLQNGEIHIDPSEVSEARWFELLELPTKIVPFHRALIIEWLKVRK